MEQNDRFENSYAAYSTTKNGSARFNDWYDGRVSGYTSSNNIQSPVPEADAFYPFLPKYHANQYRDLQLKQTIQTQTIKAENSPYPNSPIKIFKPLRIVDQYKVEYGGGSKSVTTASRRKAPMHSPPPAQDAERSKLNVQNVPF